MQKFGFATVGGTLRLDLGASCHLNYTRQIVNRLGFYLHFKTSAQLQKGFVDYKTIHPSAVMIETWG